MRSAIAMAALLALAACGGSSEDADVDAGPSGLRPGFGRTDGDRLPAIA